MKNNNKQILLDKLKQKIIENLNCPLKKEAKNLVFGKGNPNTDILFIGEAPGAKEDEVGIPFIGKAGKDLDKQLNNIKLTLDDIYITNILKYRPPKNRDPTFEEIKNHTPYLVEQIKIIQPKIICTLGNFASKYILSNANINTMKKMDGVDKLHGKIVGMYFQEEKIKVFPLHHPSSTIYSKERRKHFANDFLELKRILFEIKNIQL